MLKFDVKFILISRTRKGSHSYTLHFRQDCQLVFLVSWIFDVRNEYDTDPLEFWNIVSWYFMGFSQQRRDPHWTKNAYSLHFRGTGWCFTFGTKLVFVIVKELKENDFSSAYVWDLSGNVLYILGLAPFKSRPMWLKY